MQSFAEDSTQILIGREEQLAELEEAKQAFRRNRQPDVVWIAGLSGEGKSSLAEKFLAPLRRSGEVLVFSGRCYDRESVPFKAVDVLIEALVSFLRSRSRDQVNACAIEASWATSHQPVAMGAVSNLTGSMIWGMAITLPALAIGGIPYCMGAAHLDRDEQQVLHRSVTDNKIKWQQALNCLPIGQYRYSRNKSSNDKLFTN